VAACADGHRQRAYATGSLASHAHTRLFLALQIIVPLTGERPSESKFNTKLTIKTIMIEQRTMFVVEPSHNISEILAMYDTEKKEVLYYEQEGEVYKRLKDEKYFATRQLAEDYRTKHQAELRAKFPEIRAFVEEMDNVIEEYFNLMNRSFLEDAHILAYTMHRGEKSTKENLKEPKSFVNVSVPAI
jgi:hypothetical protein